MRIHRALHGYKQVTHAFDDWKEGREEYPNDGKQLDFSNIEDLELNFPARLGPDEE